MGQKTRTWAVCATVMAWVCATVVAWVACSSPEPRAAQGGVPGTPSGATIEATGADIGRSTCTWPAVATPTEGCDGRPASAPPASTRQALDRDGTPGVTVVRNLRYGDTAPPWQVGDLFLPGTDGAANGPRPGVVVVIHGGGWDDCSRRRGATGWYARQIAEQERVAAFNVEYRLVSEGGRYPQNLRDVRCALQWIAKNAGTYGVDGSRVAVAGESAGGHLALLLALTQDRNDLDPGCGEDPSLSAVVAYSAPSDLVTLAQASALGKGLVTGYVGACPGTSASCDPAGPTCRACDDASPLSHVCRARGHRPQMLLVHAEDPLDPLVSAAHPRRLSEALTRVSWPHQLLVVPANALRARGCIAGDPNSPAPHGLLEGSDCMTGPSAAALRRLLARLR